MSIQQIIYKVFLLFRTFGDSLTFFRGTFNFKKKQKKLKNCSQCGKWAQKRAQENYRWYENKKKVSYFLFKIFLGKIHEQLGTGTIKIQQFRRHAAIPISSFAHETNRFPNTDE